jgi:tetratricopeptide (TPR) repeat protein
LFARGQLELATGANQQVLDTARDIRSYAAAPGDPDRTEEKAASYLEGMVALQLDELEQARQLLTAAVDLHGYPYALYAGPLASLLFRQDEDAEARKILERALVVDPKEPRIDLEPQREVYRAMLAGQP